MAGCFVEGMVTALRGRGHHLDVLAPRPAQPEWRDGVHWIAYGGTRTFYGAGVPDNVSDLRAWPGLATFPLALWSAARLFRWDAVISHFGIPCGVVGARLGLPHLAIWHGADAHLAQRMRWVLASMRSSRHWFVSEASRRALSVDDAIVSPMGADYVPVDREKARAIFELSKPTVLALGRLVPIKGLYVLIDAMAGMPWQLLVAGDGPQRAELEARAMHRNVSARFLGSVHGATKANVLGAADALAIASRVLAGRTEGCPVALLEAQLAGLPVVATTTGGIPERIEHGVDGLLVAPDDPFALREGLRRALADPALGPRGRVAAAEQRWERVAQRMERALCSLTTRPR